MGEAILARSASGGGIDGLPFGQYSDTTICAKTEPGGGGYEMNPGISFSTTFVLDSNRAADAYNVVGCIIRWTIGSYYSSAHVVCVGNADEPIVGAGVGSYADKLEYTFSIGVNSNNRYSLTVNKRNISASTFNTQQAYDEAYHIIVVFEAK